MAEPVWGLLAKAQDDPQTIDEAVAAAIAAHEADPEAHLGSGESLEVHRANDTLDHPAGAVLADKNTMTEQYFTTQFENFAPFATLGDVVHDTYPGASLYIETGATENSVIWQEIHNNPAWMSNTKDMLFQVSMEIDPATNYKCLVGLVTTASYTAPRGFGIFFVNGVGKGFVGQDSGGSVVFTEDFDIDPSDTHIYRVQFFSSEDVYRFYIDGALIEEVARPGDMEGTNPLLYFGFKTNGSVDGYAHIKQTDVSRKQ